MEHYNGVEPDVNRENKRTFDIPRGGVRLFFFILYTHFNKVLLANALFLLFSVPVVTIPAALTALSRIYLLILKDGYVEVWKDFTREFRASFLNSFLLGIVYAVLFAVLLTAARTYPVMPVPAAVGTAVFSAAAAGQVLLTVAGCYAFPMNALFRLRVRDLIRNAALLTVRCPKQSLVLAALIVACQYVAVSCFPRTLPLTLTFLISVFQLAICVTVMPLFRRYLFPKDEKDESN